MMNRKILSFLLHCWIVATAVVVGVVAQPQQQQQQQEHRHEDERHNDSSAAITHDSATQTTSEQEPIIRIIRAALSAPNVNIHSLVEDIKFVFGETKLHSQTTLQELVDQQQQQQQQQLLLNNNNNNDDDDDDDDSSISTSTCKTEATTATDDDIKVQQQLQERLAAAETELPKYADRHIKNALAAAQDYDCMEREFDFSDPTINLTEAVLVLAKCRILVVRNVFAQDLIQQNKANISNYLFDLHHHKIPLGPTTVGNPFFYARRDKHRFDVILPQHLRNDDIIMNPQIVQVMQHPKILGYNMVVNTFATVVAAPGATNGHNHMDEFYTHLFDTDNDSFQTHSLSGNDIPPWAITMFTPLLNITMDHGPTEFCIGTNHLMGLSMDVLTQDPNLLLMKDGTKMANPLFEFAFDDDDGLDRDCPSSFSRIPLLNMGDAVFFDYTISHRGTANNSTDFRAIEYVLYSRPWYRDSNFDVMSEFNDSDDDNNHDNNVMSDADWAMRFTRFAVIDNNNNNNTMTTTPSSSLLSSCDTPQSCPERIPLETMLDFMHDVDPQKDYWNTNNNNNNNNNNNKNINHEKKQQQASSNENDS